MNFEQALKLIVQHRDRSKARDAQYKAIDQKRQHRHRAIREERSNRWRLHHNQQRFAHQTQLAEQRSMADIQRDQYRADQEQQQKEADEQQQIQQLNAEIDAIENNPGLSEEEKRDLTWRLRQKKMGLTPSSPPDQPNYPPEKGIGMNWKEDSGEFWPPGHPNEGQPIYVWYTRDNRHQVSVVRHERDEWHKKDNERKKTDAQTAKEDREAREEKRANWERKGTDALTALLTHPDTTPEEREEIQWILEQREKEDAKNAASNNKKDAADAKKADADRTKKIEREAKRYAVREVARQKQLWKNGWIVEDGRERPRRKYRKGDNPPPGSGVGDWVDEDEPDWNSIKEILQIEKEEELEMEYESEQPEEMPRRHDPDRHVSPLTGEVVSSEVPTNPDTGMLEIV